LPVKGISGRILLFFLRTLVTHILGRNKIKKGRK